MDFTAGAKPPMDGQTTDHHRIFTERAAGQKQLSRVDDAQAGPFRRAVLFACIFPCARAQGARTGASLIVSSRNSSKAAFDTENMDFPL